MSSGDPDLDAVLAESASPVQSGDPDLDAVLSEKKHSEASVVPGERGGLVDVLADRVIGGTVRGVVGGAKGIAALVSGKGLNAAADAVRSVTDQELKPTTAGGRAASAAMASPYNPLNYIDESGQWLGDKAEAAGAPPLVSTAARIAPDALASLLGLRRGSAAETATMAEPEAAPRLPHPLAAASDAEAARLAQIRETGVSAGLKLPEGGTPAEHAAAASHNQPIANGMVRQELNLPADAPLTPQLLTKARATFASPAYQAIEKIPKIELGEGYEAAMGDLEEIPGEIPKHLKPPEASTATGEGISGADAVDLSKKLRYRANQYDKQASISGSPEASDLADLHRGAAEALEDAVREHLENTGQGQLAKDWDAARVYTAKTYSVQNALDGAGNVKVSSLKQQLLKNKQLSGNLEALANLGAQYPQAFKLTQQSAPQAGMVRQAAATAARHLIPAGTTAVGSIFGVPGAVGGAIGGKVIADRLADRISPP